MLFSNTFSNSLKNLAKIIICFCLVYTPFFANAAVGGWTMSNPIAAGASTVYTGTKNLVINGADYVKKGTAKITPPASAVSKVLARGVAGYALSVAVEQLLGAVDWVLDPANNQIKYFIDPQDPSNPALRYLWGGHGQDKFATAKEALESSCRGYRGSSYVGISNIKISTDRADAICLSPDGLSDVGSGVTRINNPSYDPNAEREEKTLPLPTVAQKVISNAEANDKQAQVATTAAAADMVAEAEKDEAKARPIAQQLEASSTTKPADEAAADKANEATGEQTKNPDKPDTTDLKLTFPIFCNWAPTVCQAAQTVITFPTTLTEWWETGKEKAEGWASSISQAWTATKEYFKEESKEQENTEVEIEDIPKPSKTVNVSIGENTCPSMPVNIHTPFNTISTDISPVYLCQIATGMKTFFIALGFFTASLIVGRRN